MKLGGKTMCFKVELIDAPLDYNILLGQIWTYVMHVVVATVFRVFFFLHEGQIVTIDQFSFSFPHPSLGASTVPMIDNLQHGTIKLDVGLFPSLMGTFNYLPPSNNVKFISVVPNQLRDAIFQVSSFKTSYFHKPWNLPSPSALMKGIRHLGMAMPLSATNFVYNIIQQASTSPNPAPS